MTDQDSIKRDDCPPEQRFFGRRKGKTLSPRQYALVDRLMPKVGVTLPAGKQTPFVPSDMYGAPKQKIWLEIGFGKGEHLAWQAKANPDIGLIGCEPYLNGVVGLLQHIENDAIDNIRVYGDDARHVIRALPDASIDRVFLLHPDPWPKKKHAKRRFVNPANLDDIARILKDGGEFRVGTDHPIYCQWTALQMNARRDFTWLAEGPDGWSVKPDDWPETRYEAKALEGKATYFRFTRLPRA